MICQPDFPWTRVLSQQSECFGGKGKQQVLQLVKYEPRQVKHEILVEINRNSWKGFQFIAVILRNNNAAA